jgi:hypothetical protein
MSEIHSSFPIEPTDQDPQDFTEGPTTCPPVRWPMPVDPFIQALGEQLQEDLHALWALLLMLLPDELKICTKLWQATVQCMKVIEKHKET